ncbi:phage tail protein [Nitratidesulfovibrio sp. 1201_IL3209]|uniref:phage tail protein n=1 Tax=Nitratidesulfovibrio sp. 1201_IL3209 TaxID=3084053 RepID=UPI002FD94E46
MPAGSSAPDGSLVCDGSARSRTAYAALFAVVGTTYGAGDGSTTFNLPDLRGEFRRGADLGRGVDTGRVVGSAQGDAFQGHWHAGWVGLLNVSAGGSEVVRSNGVQASANAVRGPQSDGTNGSPRIASETRPRNVAVVTCIKY